MTIGMIEFNKHAFYFRSGNFGDEYVMRENLRGTQYSALSSCDEDIVLDLGGHIGTFVVSVAPRVKEVISIEMDPDCFELLRSNTEYYDNVTIIQAACVSQRTSESIVHAYRAKRNSGANSLWIKRGRGDPIEVDTIRIGDALEKFKPSIIKCDVEGSEYDIFDGLEVPDFVRQIMIEFHFGKKDWRQRANELQDKLVKSGFATQRIDFTQNKRWTQVINFKRSIK